MVPGDDGRRETTRDDERRRDGGMERRMLLQALRLPVTIGGHAAKTVVQV